ncbi:MAG: thermonuclease family protein [Hydrocarboniphaga effusa]|nr:thermonuclease family protein [Hydrocarboniphaga effusa]
MDGDSFQCSENAAGVRLLLIDSPERGQTVFHDSARAFLMQLLPRGSSAALEIDLEPKDSYGRTLAYVWLPDGRMANEELVRAGLALAFPYKGVNVRYLSRIVAAERQAREQNAGFWEKGPVTCTPQDFRHKKCTGFQ